MGEPTDQLRRVSREAVVGAFRDLYCGVLRPSEEWITAWLSPLRDATALVCWCPLDQPCHADVLIELLG